MRPSGRKLDELRAVSIETGFTKHAEGSALIKMGDTHVLCTATIEDRVPPFIKGSGLGWVTAEYGMLPRATNTRMRREAAMGKQGGVPLKFNALSVAPCAPAWIAVPWANVRSPSTVTYCRPTAARVVPLSLGVGSR